MSDLQSILKKRYNKKETGPLSTAIDATKKEEAIDVQRVSRLTSEGSIQSINSVMNNIKSLIDVVISEDVTFKIADDNMPIKTPSITFETVSRELSSKTPLRSIKTNLVKEVALGELTGDSFEIYTTWYDCIVEFNIYGIDKEHSVSLSQDVEEMLELYAGYLKKLGLSNIYFVKEISAMESFKNKKYAGVTLVYYLEIQKIRSVKVSSLKKVGVTIKKKLQEDNPGIDKMFDELSSNNTLI